MKEQELRSELAEIARLTVARGLNSGTSGNVSLRVEGGFLVTPSGLRSESAQADQMVFMDMAGSHSGTLKPSSEWRIHRDIYAARPEASAIVHAHSPYAVSLACLRRGLPAFHYMVAMAGGKDIRCADYATFGTQALSDAVIQALQGRRACLMSNHGLIAFGANTQAALALAIEVEELCAQYWRASLMGTPVLLSDAEMDVVIERFKGYGQQSN